MALALGSSNRSVVNSQRSYPLWGYRFAPVAIIVIRQEPFVFNGSHLPAMWRARSVEVSAATNDAPLPSFVFVSSLLTMSYSVSSSSSAGGMPRVTAAAAMALRSHAASRFILADMVALVTPAASHRACCSSSSLARCRRTFHAATSRRCSPSSMACVLAVVLPVMSVPFVCVPLGVCAHHAMGGALGCAIRPPPRFGLVELGQEKHGKRKRSAPCWRLVQG